MCRLPQVTSACLKSCREADAHVCLGECVRLCLWVCVRTHQWWTVPRLLQACLCSSEAEIMSESVLPQSEMYVCVCVWRVGGQRWRTLQEICPSTFTQTNYSHSSEEEGIRNLNADNHRIRAMQTVMILLGLLITFLFFFFFRNEQKSELGHIWGDNFCGWAFSTAAADWHLRAGTATSKHFNMMCSRLEHILALCSWWAYVDKSLSHFSTSS